MANLAGRWAVVTGAAGGIGRSIAIALHERGMRVVVGDLNPPQESAPLPEGVIFLRTDVTEPADLERLADACSGEAPAVWVNNAGIAVEVGDELLLRNKHAKQWRQLMDINLKAVIEGTQIAIHRHLDARRAGALQEPCYVISTASVAGLIPRAASAYAAAKAGVVHFTRSIAEQLRIEKIEGVHIYSVCPTFTDTPMARGMSGVTLMEKSAARGVLAPSDAIARGCLLLIDGSAPNGSIMRFDTVKGVTTASCVPYGRELGGPLPGRDPLSPAKL